MTSLRRSYRTMKSRCLLGNWLGSGNPSSILHLHHVLRGESSRFLPALVFCLAALANPAAAVNGAAVPARGSGDELQFLDGAVLHGALVSVEAARGLRWQHPDAKTPFDLKPAHVDFVRFPEASSLALTPSCHVRFASGDDLFGSLVSLDGGTMEFNTWFGGAMKIPRATVQTITFLPTNYSIVYEGPSDASDWVIRDLSQRSGRAVAGAQRVIINGNVVMLGGAQLIVGGGVDLSSATPAGPSNWTYRDGGFVTAGAGTLGRNFNLTGSSTIEFDLSSSGSFNLLLNLYSTALDQVEMNNNSFAVELSSSQVVFAGPAVASPPQLHNVVLTNFVPGGKPARVTLHCNKEEASLTVLVDGVTAGRWTDIGSFDDVGTGFVILNQQIGGTVKLSHFKISKWEGRREPNLASAPAGNADRVFFINHDKAGGKIEGITGGMLHLNLDGNVLHIPAGRVQRVDFAQSSAAPEPRGPWEVRAVFPGGGSVSFQLEKWDDKSVAGRSALFGSLAFQPGSIREMEFNLDRPRTGPPAVQEDQFDALDQ